MIGFNYFQAFVHQGCGIDRDLRAHRPIGMLQGRLQGRRADLVLRPSAKGSARRRDDDLGHVLAPAGGHRLEQRIVLRIDRQHGRAGLLGAAHEQRARADEAFLVGERERRAALDGRQRRLEPRRAGDRPDHPFGGATGGFRNGIRARSGLDARTGQFRLQIAVGVMIADRRKARTELPRQFGECGTVFVRRQRLDDKPSVLPLEQIDRARPDRAGRAQDRDAPRCGIGSAKRLSSNRHQKSPNKEAAGGPFQAAADETHHDGGCRRCQKSVQPVHQAAMAGDEPA